MPEAPRARSTRSRPRWPRPPAISPGSTAPARRCASSTAALTADFGQARRAQDALAASIQASLSSYQRRRGQHALLERSAARIPPAMQGRGEGIAWSSSSALQNTASAVAPGRRPARRRRLAVPGAWGDLRLALGACARPRCWATGVTGVLTAGVSAFADYERQALTTEAVIKTTGGAAGKTAQDIADLARVDQPRDAGLRRRRAHRGEPAAHLQVGFRGRL